MKISERIIEARLKGRVEISKQKYGFMSGKANYRCHVCLKNVDGKVQGRPKRALLCIRGPRESLQQVSREELWYCMRKSGMAEKYVRLVQDMYEGSKTVVRCAVGTTESFKVKVGLHQESALSPFLFAVIMDKLTDKVRREPPWTMLFADDIMIFEETREEVERRIECWIYALERREIKVVVVVVVVVVVIV